MAIQLIEKHYEFAKSGSREEIISVQGKILRGTAVVRGIEPSFRDSDDHHLKRLQMQILNVAVVGGKLKYDVNFSLSDKSGNDGQCNFDVLVIVDVDTESSLSMTSQTVTFNEPGDQQVRVPFNNTVRSAIGAIQGFDMEYADGKDHHVQTIGVQITQVRIVDDGTSVETDLTFDLNDNGNSVGKSTVNFVVLADLGAK